MWMPPVIRIGNIVRSAAVKTSDHCKRKPKRYQIANSPAPITAPTNGNAHMLYCKAFGSHLKCGIGILEYVENAIKIAFIMVAYLL